MNEVEEQRVIAALRALTGGITVTEMDTLDSHAELKARLAHPSPRRRLAVALTAAAAVVVAVVMAVQAVGSDSDPAAPAGPPPAPSEAAQAAAEDDLVSALQEGAYRVGQPAFLAGEVPDPQDLAGLWLLRQPYEASMVMDVEGRWSIGATWLTGTYTMDGDTLVRRLAGDGVCTSEDGAPVRSTSWRASIAPDDSLRLLFAGEHNVCTPADNREVWDRLWPGPSPLVDFLRDSVTALEWEAPAPGEPLPSGLYLAPETGRLLDVDGRHGYRYYDRPDDAAPVAVDEGRLDARSTPGRLDGTCRDGTFTGALQAGTIPAVYGLTDAFHVFRLTDVEGACGAEVAQQGAWVRVVPGLAS